MPSGWDNNCEEECTDHFSDRMPRTELRTRPEVLHAETNAIAKVAQSSESCYNSDLYTTTAPCLDCAKLIYQSGIKSVYYRTPHLRSTDGIDFLGKCGIPVCQM